MLNLFKNSARRRAEEIALHAEFMVGNLSFQKLNAFEKRFPRNSEKWSLIVTALAAYAATQLFVGDLFEQALPQIPKALEEKFTRNHAVCFVSLWKAITEINGPMKAFELGQWAMSLLSHEEFPAELGVVEILETTRIGNELMLVATAQAGFST